MGFIQDFMEFIKTGKAVQDIPIDLNKEQEKIEDPATPNVNLIMNKIYAYKESGVRKLMETGEKYYNNDNVINERKRFYIGRHGEKIEAPLLANNKLAHSFLKKLVDQKASYLLSKAFTIECEDKSFEELLNTYFNKSFRRQLKNLSKDAIKMGISWVQIYYDKTGKLSFDRLDPKGIIPIWHDSEHTVLEGIIKTYRIISYTLSGQKNEITKIEYWTTEGVWYYELRADKLVPDPDKESTQYKSGHFQVQIEELDEETGETKTVIKEAIWDKIPFVWLKYNPEEVPLIKYVKDLIDDYDLRRSDSSNDIEDEPNSLKVVKDYQGTDKSEFVKNVAQFGTAFVKGEGDVRIESNNIDDSKLVNHTKQTRKDLYELGRGVDTQEESLGNSSGVALGYRFMDLDLDCDDLKVEVSVYLEQVAWFIQMTEYSLGRLENLEPIDFSVEFNMDTLMSESDVIADCKNSVGIISNDTIIQNHPWVDNVTEELSKLASQQEEEDKRAMEMFNNQNPPEDNFGKDEPNSKDNKESKEK